MHFERLRLSGFKSFVEPAEFRIEPGLTGVVGPNGCGKSNLLEALRWVMGANSAKAMRGQGMDDVIFAGSGGRPGRSHAEVTLSIDNSDGGAPGALSRIPVIEVARRIDRGAGSTYRINGREVRARDVQLLFADASTGANSPALVRQGQISELIAAKPQNRRLILEEAAGVAGLHARRHEAELKVQGAEANLERLQDVVGEIEASLARLKREARQAQRYAALSSQIRLLQGALLLARWRQAREALQRLEEEAQDVETQTERAVRGAAQAAASAAEAEAALRPLRDEETAAAAVLHRLAIEKDRLDREAEGAAAELARLREESSRLASDAAREAQIVEDACRALVRLEAETAGIETEIAAAPERLPQLAAAAEGADAVRREADAEVERLAAEAAAQEARRRGAEARCEEARSRLSRTGRALDQARADRASLGDADEAPRRLAEATRAEAETALADARLAVETLEAERQAAFEAESGARAESRRLADALAALQSEAEGLAAVAAELGSPEFPAALDSIRPDTGLEAALAAALGDDLEAALDRRAPAHWAGAEADAPEWPEGVAPLEALVEAPTQLAARLAFIGLVAAEDGARLATSLPPGARLVSKEGHLWRWDGFTRHAGATTAAEARLRQRARLSEIETEIAAKAPLAEAAVQAAAAVAARLAAAELALRPARARPREAEAAVTRAREALEALAREGARRDARAQSLDETVARFEVEFEELQAQLAAAEAAFADLAPDETALLALDAARRAAGEARTAAAAAIAARDVERRERDGRLRRLEALASDRADWAGRAQAAGRRREQLLAEREKTEAAVVAALETPSRTEERRVALLGELATAEARKTMSSDALAVAETARADADRGWRAAEAAAAAVRERRAGLSARLDAVRDRFAEAAAQIRERIGQEPEALGRRLGEADAEATSDTAGAESRLAQFERERELIGAVNLRAEADAQELGARLESLKAERADLAAAIAKLRQGVAELNAAGRERLNAAFTVINEHFRSLFTTLFEGGQAELRLVESDDPLEAGLEIFACPPGKRLAVMSLLSGGEQALAAVALIFAVFLANPAPICVLDEVDAPLDDANVERFCNLLDEMRRRAPTRFVAITHNPLTMSRMDRLFGVTMPDRGVSQLVSVDLRQAEALAAQ